MPRIGWDRHNVNEKMESGFQKNKPQKFPVKNNKNLNKNKNKQSSLIKLSITRPTKSFSGDWKYHPMCVLQAEQTQGLQDIPSNLKKFFK